MKYMNEHTLYEDFTNIFFKQLTGGFAIKASRILVQTIYYMYFRGYISNATLKEIVSVLKLDKGWRYLRKNADETISLYVGNSLIDTFEPYTLVLWLLKVISKDYIFQNRYGNIENFLRHINNECIPDNWEEACEYFVKFNSLFFTKTHIVWLKKDNYYDQGIIYKTEYELSEEIRYNMSNREVVHNNVKTILDYDVEKERLYFTVDSFKGYMCYDFKTNQIQKEEGQSFVGIKNEGIWYFDDDEVLKFNEKKLLNLQSVHYKLELTKENDVIVKPVVYGFDVFLPYRVKSDGEIIQCSRSYCAKYLWSIIMGQICTIKDYMIDRTVSCELERDKLYDVPYPFTIEQIEQRINNYGQKGILRKGRIFPIKSMLKLLKNKGVGENEDITEILYTLWKYQKLCMERYRELGIFHKVFYFIMYDVAKKTDFIKLLCENPEEVFKEKIYWTNERIKEYEKELEKQKKEWSDRMQICSDEESQEDKEVEIDLDEFAKLFEDGLTDDELNLLIDNLSDEIDKKIKELEEDEE